SLFDIFGYALAPLGDLNGDGSPDLAVTSRGRIWILFLRPDGSVASFRTIDDFHLVFGKMGLASLGDLDGDGSTDLAAIVGTDLELFFLQPDGGVKLAKTILPGSNFHSELAYLGQAPGSNAHYLVVNAPSRLWRIELSPAGDVLSVVQASPSR